MLNKVLNILYHFDMFGPFPKLYIFKRERYQSLFSLLFSFLIMLLLFTYTFLSIVDYIQNERPTVVYSKSNDKEEERKKKLEDTLLMFQFIDLNTFKKLDDSIAYLEAEYKAVYNTGESESSQLKINYCEFGVNLNPKYKEFFEERFNMLSKEYNQSDKEVKNFFCIDNPNSDKSLFYHPDIGYSNVIINIKLNNQNSYDPKNISLMIVYENNLINHNHKDSPISEGISFQFIQGFSYNEYTSVNYYFQYLKYETDDGLFFDNIKYLRGISFLDMSYYRSNQNMGNLDLNSSSIIGDIIIELNKSNYDYYRRTYKKLQTLLAEIMSVVSLVFQILSKILTFLNKKKMSVDIITKLFEVDNENKLKKLAKNYNAVETDRIKIVPEKINKSFELKEKISLEEKTSEKIINEPKNKNVFILKKINIINVIKSFICNSNKDKLVSLCHDIIITDMCIETILQKFYNLERIYNELLDINKYDLGLNKNQKFRQLNSIINVLNNEIKKQNNKLDN